MLQNPPRSLSSKEANTELASNLGIQHQITLPVRSTSAEVWQFPMRPKSSCDTNTLPSKRHTLGSTSRRRTAYVLQPCDAMKGFYTVWLYALALTAAVAAVIALLILLVAEDLTFTRIFALTWLGSLLLLGILANLARSWMQRQL